MLNENSILQDRMSNIKKRMTIAELLGISNRFKHLKMDKDDKSKYISQILFSFNISEQNAELDIMISQLADYRKHVQINRQNKKSKENVNSSVYSLFHFLEKNLLEISYISDKEKRIERIRTLYDWFKNKQKYYEDISTITMKTYKEKGEVDEQEALLMKKKDQKQIISDDSNHRNLELINKRMLNEYERKRLRGPSWAINKNLASSQSIQPLSILGKDSMLQTISMLSGSDIQTGDYTTLYSSVNGTNYYTKKNFDNEAPLFIDRPEGGLLEKDYISQAFSDNNIFLPPLNKETKYSYSYLRPTYNFNEVYLENKIMESKQKSLAIKRAQEEIKEKVKEFGINRARYKEKLNNKYELKNMINMYVNRNKLSSPMLRKYKIKNKEENIKKKIKENDNFNPDNSNNNNNLNINFSFSNTSSPARINPAQKYSNSSISEMNEEIKFDYPSSKSIKKDIAKSNRDKINNSMKKISFSYSQKMKIYDFKENKEKNDSSKQINKFTPKRTFTNRKKTKFVKKRSNSQSSIISGLKLFSEANNKIKTDNIKNIDIKTNNILDIENIKTDNYKISLPKEQIKTIILKKNKNNILKAPDSLTTVTSNLPIIKEKFTYNNICQINSRNLDNNNIESKTSQEIYGSNPNFHISPFNKYDIANINKSNNHFIKKNQFENLNQRYNLYKNNFLRMRKSISIDKKKEYESLVDKLRGKTINDYYYNDDFDDEMIEIENPGNSSIVVNNIVGKSFGLKKSNSLLQAIVNPNDNPVYSQYYLPRNGSMLLSRDEQNKKLIK